MNVNPAAERLRYVIAVVLYGTIGMFLRYVDLPSEIVALCRGSIGAVFIFLYQKSRHQAIDLTAIRRNLFWLLLSGICLGLNWIFLFAAYIQTTVAIASLCNYMAPLIVILITPFVLHEPLSKRKLPFVAMAFIGIILVSGVLGGETGNLSGVIMGLLAAAAFVVIVICNRKIHDIPSLDKSIVQLAVSALTILPYVLVKNHGAALHPDARSLMIVLMLGVIHTGFAYILYFSAMHNLPVTTFAVIGYLEPVVSVLCSAFFLHEPMGIQGWIGAVLIIGAAVMCEISGDRAGGEAVA